MRIFFTLLALACSFMVMAQGHSKITGIVNDSTSGNPVEFATVALVDPSSGNALDGTVCDNKGEFTLNKIAEGKYAISITFIGFETKTIAFEVDGKKDVDLGAISISPTPQLLGEVTVEGQRALIEERVDRTIYNAENDATTKGGDATDVLKRVPMLSVDIDGNVSLRGSQNILVLIDNKPSSIVASSVADALKQIPADEIKAVEVITSPSAKYDAEGSGGIINIVTKKNNLQGLTLNINSGAGYRGSNLGLNGNYRKGKMGFSLGGWGRSNYNVTGNFYNEQLTRTVADDPVTGQEVYQETFSTQSADTRNHGLFGNYNFGWDYDINKKNSLAASVRFGVRNGKNYQDDLQQYTNGTLTRLQDIISNNQSNNVDVSLNYTRLFAKPSREFSIQGLYSRNNRENVFENLMKDQTDLSTLSRFKNLNDSYNQEVTIQADYQTPVGTNQMIEFGGKGILRKAVSDYISYNASGSDGVYQPSGDNDFSNNLNYDQSITAGYLSYTLATKAGYSLKAGSRYEYATITAYTQTEDDIAIPSYGVLVPSINLSKKLKGGNMIKASYNRRIQRPSIRYLNPNIQQSNPLNVTIGNPVLDPEYTNNVELAYSTFIKGTMLNFSLFTRNTNDAIQSVRDVIGKDNTDADTIRTTYQNIGQENTYGVSIFANVSIGKLSLNGGGDIYYAVMDNNNPDPFYRASNEGLVASGRIFGNYELNKGWGLQFFSFMRGRRVQLQGTQGGFYMYSLAVRKQFNEKRGSVGIGLENFLQQSIKMRTDLESPLLIQKSVNTRNNFSFRINFSYRIGKMTVENRPRRRRSINNDDLKEGDGGSEGMQMMGGENGGQQRGGMQMSVNAPRNQGRRKSTPSAATTAPRPADGIVYEAAGTWAFTIDSPQGGKGTLVIKKENDVYSGTIKTERMKEETPLSSVTVKGNEVTASYTVSFGGNAIPVEIKATLNNGDMRGTMNLGQSRSFNLTGKRSN